MTIKLKTKIQNNNSTCRGEVKIDLLSPPSGGFHYELSFFKSGSTSINTEDQGKVILVFLNS